MTYNTKKDSNSKHQCLNLKNLVLHTCDFLTMYYNGKKKLLLAVSAH